MLRAETPFVPSTTRVEGKLAIRPCFVNASTTLDEVTGLAKAVIAPGTDSPGSDDGTVRWNSGPHYHQGHYHVDVHEEAGWYTVEQDFNDRTTYSRTSPLVCSGASGRS